MELVQCHCRRLFQCVGLYTSNEDRGRRYTDGPKQIYLLLGRPSGYGDYQKRSSSCDAHKDSFGHLKARGTLYQLLKMHLQQMKLLLLKDLAVAAEFIYSIRAAPICRL